jgi:hypothetical protein
VKSGGSLKILFSVISSPITGTAKVKIVKNERDPLLFTGELLLNKIVFLVNSITSLS